MYTTPPFDTTLPCLLPKPTFMSVCHQHVYKCVYMCTCPSVIQKQLEHSKYIKWVYALRRGNFYCCSSNCLVWSTLLKCFRNVSLNKNHQVDPDEPWGYRVVVFFNITCYLGSTLKCCSYLSCVMSYPK